MTLQGKNALVTGSSRGIGRAIALALAKNGCNIVVNYAGNKAKAVETVEEIRALGVQAKKIQANVAEESAVKEMVKEVVKTFGSLDILVNNAGITRDNLLMRMKVEEFEQVIDTNLKGAFLCTKAVTRPMMKKKNGRNIKNASIVG